MKNPKLIIYDWDNTLADTTQVVANVINKMRQELSYAPMTPDEIMEYTGNPDRDWVIDLFKKRTDEFKQKYSDYYNQEVARLKTEFLPYARELLEKVQSLKILQAIVTNKDTPIAMRECRDLKANHFFNSFIGKDDVQNKKPAIDGVLKIIKTAQETTGIEIHKEDVWFVGDTMIDAACAMNFGCKFLYVGKLNWITPKYKDFVINITSLLEILSNIS